MRIGNFSVLIPEGREHGSGHVALPHNTQYVIRMGNHGSPRCDATVEVDGKEVGSFRINGYGNLVLERSVNDTGRFTFFEADSAEGASAGAGEIATDLRGLVRVTFRPEKYVKPIPFVGGVRTIRGMCAPAPRMGGSIGQSAGGWSTQQYGAVSKGPEPTCGGFVGAFPTNQCDMGGSYSAPAGAAAGVTGLTGSSNQTFYEVPNLDYDPAGEVIITLRLVEATNAVRPLQAVQRGNPTPAPVH